MSPESSHPSPAGGTAHRPARPAGSSGSPGGCFRRVGQRAVLIGFALLLAGGLTACASQTPNPSGPETPTPAGTDRSPSAADRGPKREPSELSEEQATSLLTDAVADGDLARVRRALANDADIEIRNRRGQTPLVVATKAERTRIARALLEAGADPNAKDDIQDSAFLYAGAEGLNEILAATLEHGADVRSTNRFDGTALIPASEHGHVETVRMLLAAGVPVDHVNGLGWTALHEAIVLGNGSDRHVTVVELLLAAGADPSIPDGDGVPPRQLAADRGYHAIVDAIDRA